MMARRSITILPRIFMVYCFAALLALLLAGCTPVKERIAESITVLKDPKTPREQQKEAARKLAKIGEPAIPALFEMLRPEYRHAEYAVAYAVGRMGPKAVPWIIKGLDDERTFLRAACASMIAGNGARFGKEVPAAVSGLSRMLERDRGEPAVQAAAVLALKEIGQAARPAVPALLGVAISNDWSLCDRAVKALSSISSESLRLVPVHPKEDGIGSFGTHQKWDLERMIARIGRLDSGRLDRNGDWMLTRDEISTAPLLSAALDLKKGKFLTFSEAGKTAFDSFFRGYVAGQADRYKKPADEVSRYLESESARCMIAKMMLGYLEKYDADQDGVLSDREHRKRNEGAR